jgi:hypothetical protein
MEGDQPEAETWSNKLWSVLRDLRAKRAAPSQVRFTPTRIGDRMN